MFCAWAQVSMSNIAALCYRDAAHWWMSNTPLQSSHTRSLSLWVAAPASSWAEEWRKKNTLMWVDTGFLLHQDTGTYPALLLLADEPQEGFPWLSCSIVARQLFFSFLSICQHTTYLSHCESLPICLSADCWWVVCQYQSGSWHSCHSLCEILRTCSVTNMACYVKIYSSLGLTVAYAKFD